MRDYIRESPAAKWGLVGKTANAAVQSARVIQARVGHERRGLPILLGKGRPATTMVAFAVVAARANASWTHVLKEPPRALQRPNHRGPRGNNVF
jgi:hypothetical protein